jgi:hypothetical protein
VALPSSGQLGIGAIRTELSSGSGSLRTLSSLAGKSTPDAISEFYGYSAGDADFLLNLDAANSSSYGGSGTTWADLSGKGNNGTLTNRSSSNPSWNSSGWFQFSGSNPYGTYQNGGYVSTVDGAFSRVQSQNRVTLSVWVYPTENSYPMIIAGNSYNGGIPGWQGYQIWLYQGSLYGRITVNNTTTYVDISAFASYYSWNHCVLTYDGSNARFYLNDTLVGTSAISGTISSISPNRFLIGCQYNAQGATNTAEFFTGYISKVRLYSRVLSGPERSSIYNAGR